MLKLAILVAGLTACASGYPVSQVPRPVAAATSAPDAGSQFPAMRSSPDLRRARSVATRETGPTLQTANLEVCVSPHGNTASVKLRRSTGDRSLDSALVDDVGEWRYEPFAAPANSVTCEQTTVTFVR